MATYPKDFSPILALGLVMICVYLLMTNRLTGGQTWLALLSCAFIVVAVHNLDAIGNFRVKAGGAEAVMEMKELRDEVYAKVDELKKVASGVATFTVQSIVHEGRMVGEDEEDRVLRRRDDLERFLRDAGIAAPQIAETILPITRIVDWDMRRKIVINGVSSWRLPKGANPNNPPEREEYRKRLVSTFEQPDRMKALDEAEVLLRPFYDPENPTLINSVTQYRRMLTSGQLPKVGPANDMEKPPLD